MQRLLLTMTVTLAALLATTSGASAATCNFQGPGSGWHSAANWDCLMIPGAGDTAVVGGGRNVTVDQADSVAALTISDGTITFSGNPTLTVSGATSVSGGAMTGNGTLSATSGGSFTKTTSSQFAIQNGADLVLNVAATQDGGEICLQDLGGGDPSLQINAQYTIATGAATSALSCSNAIDGPTVRISATGSIVKTAAGLTQFFTPVDNDGQITVSAGQLNISGGDGAGDAGTYSTAAGAITNFDSTHTLTAGGVITGAGTTVFSQNVTLPADAALTATTINHNGGTLAIAGTSVLTPQTYNLHGGTLTSTRPLQPTAALNVSGGTMQGNFTTTVNAPATFAKTTAGQFAIQNGADLVLNVAANQDGGEICLQDLGGGDPSLQINAQYTIAPGAATNALTCSNALDGPTVFVNSGGSIVKSASNLTQFLTPVRVAGGALTVSTGQTLNIGAGLEQTAGQTTISAGGTVGSGTSAAISGGVMTVDGNYSGNPTISGSGVLTGSGTVTGTVTNTSGTVRPGSSPGTLSITGPYTQGAGGTLEIEVDGAAAGSGFDVLAVGGAASLNGKLKVIQGAFDPVLSDVFQVLTSGSRSGAFATLEAPALPGGKDYKLEYPGSPSFGARLVLTPPTPPVNTSPPTLTGTGAVGQTLNCQPGSWDNNPTFDFQWLRDGQPIGGAGTYAVVAADVTHQIACRVTATNSDGVAQATTAAVTISAVAPQNTAAPTTSGTAAVGSTLTCTPGTWTGAPAFAFQWLRDGQPIDGATQPAYDIVAADAAHAIRCRVTATNASGSQQATSAAASIAAIAPQNTAPPTTSGTAAVGSTLTCVAGAWTGTEPTFSFQWLRDGQPIDGAASSTYVVAAADASHQIACRVRASNAGGEAAAFSAASAVPAVEPKSGAPPTSGAKSAEQVLAARTPEQVATAIGLPPAKQCVGKRFFPIAVRRPRGVTIRAVAVLVNGRKVGTRKSGGGFVASADLSGLRKGRFTVRITITTRSGVKIVGQRRYRACAPKA